jgi:hypothetical protein
MDIRNCYILQPGPDVVWAVNTRECMNCFRNLKSLMFIWNGISVAFMRLTGQIWQYTIIPMKQLWLAQKKQAQVTYQHSEKKHSFCTSTDHQIINYYPVTVNHTSFWSRWHGEYRLTLVHCPWSCWSQSHVWPSLPQHVLVLPWFDLTSDKLMSSYLLNDARLRPDTGIDDLASVL